VTPQSLAARHQREHQWLLRQYLAKGADLRRFDQAALDAIAAELNGRPRQTLSFKTPSQTLAEALH
jgi:IS30 family transposase